MINSTLRSNYGLLSLAPASRIKATNQAPTLRSISIAPRVTSCMALKLSSRDTPKAKFEKVWTKETKNYLMEISVSEDLIHEYATKCPLLKPSMIHILCLGVLLLAPIVWVLKVYFEKITKAQVHGFMAGLHMRLFGPRKQHLVEGPVKGSVSKIGWFYTTIKTDDGEVKVRNEKLLKDVIPGKM